MTDIITRYGPREQGRRDLYNACLTRVLTDDELRQVFDMDIDLVIPIGKSYNEEEKRREFQQALFFQGQLRIFAKAQER